MAKIEIWYSKLVCVSVPVVDGKWATPGDAHWEIEGKPVSKKLDFEIEEAIKKWWERR